MAAEMAAAATRVEGEEAREAVQAGTAGGGRSEAGAEASAADGVGEEDSLSRELSEGSDDGADMGAGGGAAQAEGYSEYVPAYSEYVPQPEPPARGGEVAAVSVLGSAGGHDELREREREAEGGVGVKEAVTDPAATAAAELMVAKPAAADAQAEADGMPESEELASTR
eukprot:4664654-Pleurochrysis_carterae.AAC.2